MVWIWLVVMAAGVVAHEIPRDVRVEMRVVEDGERVRVFARVPLRAMRDVEFPELDGKYLDVVKVGPLLASAAEQWVANAIRLKAGERMLGRPNVVATRLAVESDRSFESWKGEPTGELGLVVWQQLWLDVAMEVPAGEGKYSLRPGMEGLGLNVVTVVAYRDRVYELHGDADWVELDPSWWGAARRFVQLGFWHILDGADHLLFLLCLVIPAGGLWRLVGVVSAFTVAHSLTLIGSVLGLTPNGLWFPAAVEVVIAASIVWMAIENVTGVGGRWIVVAAFGLVHGFGFSFALRESLQFAGGHVLSSLLAFNLGVELGQVLVVGALWLVLQWLSLSRVWVIVLSAFIAHTGWHWMWERWDVLRKYWAS